MLARSATGIAKGILGIPHADSVHLQTVGMTLVRQPGKAGICVGVVLEEVPPFLHRELGNNHGGLSAVAAFDNLEEIAAFVYVQIHEAKVVYNQQIICSHLINIVVT